MQPSCEEGSAASTLIHAIVVVCTPVECAGSRLEWLFGSLKPFTALWHCTRMLRAQRPLAPYPSLAPTPDSWHGELLVFVGCPPHVSFAHALHGDISRVTTKYSCPSKGVNHG